MKTQECLITLSSAFFADRNYFKLEAAAWSASVFWLSICSGGFSQLETCQPLCLGQLCPHCRTETTRILDNTYKGKKVSDSNASKIINANTITDSSIYMQRGMDHCYEQLNCERLCK